MLKRIAGWALAVSLLSTIPAHSALGSAPCFEYKVISATAKDGKVVQVTRFVEVPCIPAGGSGGGTSDGGHEDAPAWTRPTRPGVFVPECWSSTVDFLCDAAPTPGAPSTPRAATRHDAEAIVQEALQTLTIPQPTISIGPDPSVNKWDSAVVGFPLWLWADIPREASTSRTFAGSPLELTARLVDITYSMGDGHTITCPTATPYPVGIKPGTPSPTCGYAYQKASRPTGDYTITATARWTVSWRALGFTGTLPTTTTATRQVPVVELQAVVVR